MYANSDDAGLLLDVQANLLSQLNACWALTRLAWPAQLRLLSCWRPEKTRITTMSSPLTSSLDKIREPGGQYGVEAFLSLCNPALFL